MPFKDPDKRREYARKYYSSKEQKDKKKVYDRKRYLITGNLYKVSRSMHTVPHRYIYNGDWICKECGSTDNLIVHHINGNHKDNAQTNLMCLCNKCHSKLHISNRKRTTTGQVMPVANN